MKVLRKRIGACLLLSIHRYWEQLNQWEYFKKMPQKPHFNLLDGSKDMYLEGLVIGYMLTFAKVVEQTSKLQVSDPTSIFNGCLKHFSTWNRMGLMLRLYVVVFLRCNQLKKSMNSFKNSCWNTNVIYLSRLVSKARLQ